MAQRDVREVLQKHKEETDSERGIKTERDRKRQRETGKETAMKTAGMLLSRVEETAEQQPDEGRETERQRDMDGPAEASAAAAAAALTGRLPGRRTESPLALPSHRRPYRPWPLICSPFESLRINGGVVVLARMLLLSVAASFGLALLLSLPRCPSESAADRMHHERQPNQIQETPTPCSSSSNSNSSNNSSKGSSSSSSCCCCCSCGSAPGGLCCFSTFFLGAPWGPHALRNGQ